MMGLAKSRRSQARIMARVKSTQYANLADFRTISLLAKLHALHAQVAAQEARALPIHPNRNILFSLFGEISP
jgi:hypothetical protein